MKPLFRISAIIALSLVTLAATSHAEDPKPARIAFGEEVDIKQHLVAGKTVLFDFTSKFCPPCERIAPLLHKLDASREDLVVVEVDINRPDVKGIDWKSPVAAQYGLQSVPHFKIFGPDGKLVAEGPEARKIVNDWLSKE